MPNGVRPGVAPVYTPAGQSNGGGRRRRNPYTRLIDNTRDAVAADGGDGLTAPPAYSFDPAIEAERRAAQRGLEDVSQDTRIAARRARQIKRQDIKDIRIDKRRGRQDLGIQLERGLKTISERRQDIQTKSARGFEDIGRALDELTHKYSGLARRQGEVINAQGGVGGGASRAAAAQRASNFAFDREPIDTEARRLTQDTGLAQQRLGRDESELRQDVQLGRHRLTQDVRHDTKITRQQYHQQIGDLQRRLQRAIREQRLGDVELIREEIFQARERRPGTFDQQGQRRRKDK